MLSSFWRIDMMSKVQYIKMGNQALGANVIYTIPVFHVHVGFWTRWTDARYPVIEPNMLFERVLLVQGVYGYRFEY